MEQFRQIGEVMGSLRALMVFRDEIQVNQRQCSLLLDALTLAFGIVSQEMKQNLKFNERQWKWSSLEAPLKELCSVFKDAENYIKQFLDTRGLLKAFSLSQNPECVEFHLHNLFWCMNIVVEAIETVGEGSGHSDDELCAKRKKLIYSKKYEKEWMDPKLFQIKFGKQYMLSQDLVSRMSSAWKEDQWLLTDMVTENRSPGFRPMSREEERMKELFVNPRGKVFPASILVGSKDYQLKRRLEGGVHIKEIQWMWHTFALRNFFRESAPSASEVETVTSVSHPNVMNVLYAFYDEERRECFLTMELMSKSLSAHFKETSTSKKRSSLSTVVAVDLMLQIARGMEYLHSRKICHNDLTPLNILIKPRQGAEGYFHAKVTGFGLLGGKAKTSGNQHLASSSIWHAPEVLPEHHSGELVSSKFSEKADVYSFAMVCFQLLTGKVPFEDVHLHSDDKVNRNVKAGVRPLFPFTSSTPKYLTNFTKKCWHADPSQRPTFAVICRVLRNIKRYLVLNPENGQASEASSPVPLDYYDIDNCLSKNYAAWFGGNATKVSDIPFQMFAHRVVEKDKSNLGPKEKNSESESDGNSASGDEHLLNMLMLDEPIPFSPMTPMPSMTNIVPAMPQRSASWSNLDKSKKVVPKKGDKKAKLQKVFSRLVRPSSTKVTK